MIPAGGGDSVRAWVVYPERKTKAPVVVVVHEIFGLSTWIRGVADQLAADGFIAIAPDFLTGKNVPTDSTGAPRADSAVAAIRTVKSEDVQRRVSAAARYGMSLPAAVKKYGIVGFCWGGSVSFLHGAVAPELGASVVYYGGAPDSAQLSRIQAPVLGLFAENDARVNSTIPRADSVLLKRGTVFEHTAFTGAGHGFLRAQDGDAPMNVANRAAAKEAWPRTVAWFRRYLDK
jgi:carboxymethylenebutenolidase